MFSKNWICHFISLAWLMTFHHFDINIINYKNKWTRASKCFRTKLQQIIYKLKKKSSKLIIWSAHTIQSFADISILKPCKPISYDHQTSCSLLKRCYLVPSFTHNRKNLKNHAIRCPKTFKVDKNPSYLGILGWKKLLKLIFESWNLYCKSIWLLLGAPKNFKNFSLRKN